MCDEIRLDLELFDFHQDQGLDVVLAANKMDKVHNTRQEWIDQVAPICAKKDEIEPLQRIIRSKT